MADTVHEIMSEACRIYGSERVFNASCFGLVFMRVAGLSGPLDGVVVRTILSGREDVEPLDGGAHYRLVRPEGPKLTRFDLIG